MYRIDWQMCSLSVQQKSIKQKTLNLETMANAYEQIRSISFGKELISEGVFNRFRELEPAIGKNYGMNNLHKLLVVAESNYFEDKLETKSVFKVAKDWYQGENCSLIPEEKKGDVKSWIGEGYPIFNNLFKSMKTVLNESNIKYDPYLLEEFAFYKNYFLRPASRKGTNISFKKDCKQIDREVAGMALSGIIDLINPDILIFTSKYAYEEFSKYCQDANLVFENTKIKFVYHPSRHFSWNHRNGLGKQEFERLLREYWLNS
jgi:hypothetical protein